MKLPKQTTMASERNLFTLFQDSGNSDSDLNLDLSDVDPNFEPRFASDESSDDDEPRLPPPKKTKSKSSTVRSHSSSPRPGPSTSTSESNTWHLCPPQQTKLNLRETVKCVMTKSLTLQAKKERELGKQDCIVLFVTFPCALNLVFTFSTTMPTTLLPLFEAFSLYFTFLNVHIAFISL